MPKWCATSCTTVIRTSSTSSSSRLDEVEQRAAEDEDPVRQLAGDRAVPLGQRDAVVQPEQVVGLALGRLVLDEHDDVLDERGQLVGDAVEGLVDQRVEPRVVHVDRHRPHCGRPDGEKRMATPTGLEPAASAVTGRRANQLRYGARLLHVP